MVCPSVSLAQHSNYDTNHYIQLIVLLKFVPSSASAPWLSNIYLATTIHPNTLRMSNGSPHSSLIQNQRLGFTKFRAPSKTEHVLRVLFLSQESYKAYISHHSLEGTFPWIGQVTLYWKNVGIFLLTHSQTDKHIYSFMVPRSYINFSLNTGAKCR